LYKILNLFNRIRLQWNTMPNLSGTNMLCYWQPLICAFCCLLSYFQFWLVLRFNAEISCRVFLHLYHSFWMVSECIHSGDDCWKSLIQTPLRICILSVHSCTILLIYVRGRVGTPLVILPCGFQLYDFTLLRV
jgi:hypothetical protein